MGKVQRQRSKKKGGCRGKPMKSMPLIPSEQEEKNGLQPKLEKKEKRQIRNRKRPGLRGSGAGFS